MEAERRRGTEMVFFFSSSFFKVPLHVYCLCCRRCASTVLMSTTNKKFREKGSPFEQDTANIYVPFSRTEIPPTASQCLKPIARQSHRRVNYTQVFQTHKRKTRTQRS